jgi:hypothetical protein
MILSQIGIIFITSWDDFITTWDDFITPQIEMAFYLSLG